MPIVEPIIEPKCEPKPEPKEEAANEPKCEAKAAKVRKPNQWNIFLKTMVDIGIAANYHYAMSISKTLRMLIYDPMNKDCLPITKKSIYDYIVKNKIVPKIKKLEPTSSPKLLELC